MHHVKIILAEKDKLSELDGMLYLSNVYSRNKNDSYCGYFQISDLDLACS